MKFVCDGIEATWFRIETPGEAALESRDMDHAVERYYRDAYQKAVQSYSPPAGAPISEQNIGLKDHIQRVMPRFLTLRGRDGTGLVTAMLPPEGKGENAFRAIIVGKANTDPYPEHHASIDLLAAHCGLILDRDRCYPYRRG